MTLGVFILLAHNSSKRGDISSYISVRVNTSKYKCRYSHDQVIQKRPCTQSFLVYNTSSLIAFVAVAVAAKTGAPGGSNALISPSLEYSCRNEPLLEKVKINKYT